MVQPATMFGPLYTTNIRMTFPVRIKRRLVHQLVYYFTNVAMVKFIMGMTTMCKIALTMKIGMLCALRVREAALEKINYWHRHSTHTTHMFYTFYAFVLFYGKFLFYSFPILILMFYFVAHLSNVTLFAI